MVIGGYTLAGDTFSHAVDKDREGNKIKERINLRIEKKDYCGFKGLCLEYINVTAGLCFYCIYRNRFDIPKMIEEYRKK